MEVRDKKGVAFHEAAPNKKGYAWPQGQNCASGSEKSGMLPSVFPGEGYDLHRCNQRVSFAKYAGDRKCASTICPVEKMY